MDKNVTPWKGKRAADWYANKMAERTNAAIKKQDADFIEANKDAPDEVLLEAVRKRAEELGYGPPALEVPGYDLIIQRFGNWKKVLAAAGIQKSGSRREYKETERYKAEYLRQQQLHREEKAQHKEEKRLRAEANAAARLKKKLEKQYTPPKKRDPAPDREPVATVQKQDGQ